MTETKLFHSDKCKGYFGTKRDALLVTVTVNSDNTYYGEHTTTVDGNGRNPGKKELLAVGLEAGMKKDNCIKIIDSIQTCVEEMLEVYIRVNK